MTLQAKRRFRRAKNENERLARRIEFWLWTMFGLFLLCGFTVPANDFTAPSVSYRVCNLLTYVCAVAMLWIVGTRFDFLYRASRRINALYGWLGPCLFVTVSGLLTGYCFIADRGKFPHSIAYEFLPMLAATLVVLGKVLSGMRERLMRMFALQSFMAGILAIYIVYRYPIAERGDIASPHYFAFGLCSFSVFAVGYLRNYSANLQVATILGFAGFAYLTLSYQSRGGSLLTLLLLPMLFLVTQFREGIDGIINRRTVIAVVIILLSLVYWLRRPEVRAQIQIGVDGTLKRLFSGDSSYNLTGFAESVNTEVEASRGAEAQEFLSKSTIVTWAVGHGWGGGWSSDVMAQGNDWQMVHFGPLNLVLKGGILLALCFHVLIFAGMFRSWRCIGHDGLAAPSFCYLVFYYGNFIKHGPIGHSYTTYVTWIILGIALSCTKLVGGLRMMPIGDPRVALVKPRPVLQH